MHSCRLLVPAAALIALGCALDQPVSPDRASAVSPPANEAEVPGAQYSAAALNSAVEAVGSYHFFIPADFNGGIFGVAVDNDVSFVARRDASGEVTGRFRYVQSVEGERFIFSGSVTCLVVYDTPVLSRFPDIPAMSANRAKWGGVIEESNDPTLPAGGFLWFQSIDNNSSPGQDPPDLSTLAGFGNEAANEAFCNSANVPNPNFGPHAVGSGNITVR